MKILSPFHALRRPVLVVLFGFMAAPAAYSYYFLGNESSFDWRYDTAKQAYQDDQTTSNNETINGGTKKYAVYSWSRSNYVANNTHIVGGTTGGIVGLESTTKQGAFRVRFGADDGNTATITLNRNNTYGVYLSHAGHATLQSVFYNTTIQCNGQMMTGMHIAGTNAAQSNIPNKVYVDNLQINMNNTNAAASAGQALRTYNKGVITNVMGDGSVLRGVAINMGSTGTNGTALSALEGGTIDLHKTMIDAGSLSSTAVILMESEKGGSNVVRLSDSQILSKDGNTLINSNRAAGGTKGSVSTVSFHNVDLSAARNQKIVVGADSTADILLSGTTHYHGWTESAVTAALHLVVDAGSWWVTQESFLGDNGALQTLNGGLLTFSYQNDLFSVVNAGEVALEWGTKLILDVGAEYFAAATAEAPIEAELFRFSQGENFSGGDDVRLLTNDSVEWNYTRVEGTYYVTGAKGLPIPEPSAIAFGLTGLSAMMLRRRARVR